MVPNNVGIFTTGSTQGVWPPFNLKDRRARLDAALLPYRINQKTMSLDDLEFRFKFRIHDVVGRPGYSVEADSCGRRSVIYGDPKSKVIQYWAYVIAAALANPRYQP